MRIAPVVKVMIVDFAIFPSFFGIFPILIFCISVRILQAIHTLMRSLFSLSVRGFQLNCKVYVKKSTSNVIVTINSNIVKPDLPREDCLFITFFYYQLCKVYLFFLNPQGMKSFFKSIFSLLLVCLT